MISTDHAIERKEQDKLHRYPLALSISELILRYNDTTKESFVIGVDGAWGTGKTSFVNLVLDELGNKVIPLSFNPWLFSDQNSLLESFFNAFAQTIKPYVERDTLGTLKKYSKTVADVDIGLSFWGIGINPFKMAASFFSLFGDSSLIGQRDKINKALRKIDKKIVVVIDDIDRLDPEETKLIFKLIKVSANFRNTIFIIAYDRTRVAQQLSNKDTGFEGGEYLKKIVQVNFLLPVPEPEDLWDILFADLNGILRDMYGTDDVDNTRWGEVFHGGLSGLFKTIRDVKSFVNSLKLDWSIVGAGEVNKIDFIAIEAIRVFAPEFYNQIADNQALFTGRMYFAGLRSNDDQAAKKEHYKKLLDTVPEPIRKNIDEICQKLFPQLDTSRHGGDIEIEWRRDKKVCSPEIFRFYFKLGLPRGEVSNNELENLKRSLDNQQDFYSNLKRFDEEKKLRKILSRFLDYNRDLTPQSVKNLIASVWRIQEETTEKRTNVWDFDDVETSGRRLIYHTIKENIPRPDRPALIAEVFRDTTQLSSSIHFIRVLLDELKQSKGGRETLLEDNAGVNLLKNIGLQKIHAIVKNGSIQKQKRMFWFLFAWRDFGEEEKMKAYVKKLISTKEGLLDFLSNAVSLVLSSNGNYEAISKADIGALYPIEEFEKKVQEITDKDLELATEEQRKAVNLFKNPSREW
jgi:predicted KAP-like P-loop ATPase